MKSIMQKQEHLQQLIDPKLIVNAFAGQVCDKIRATAFYLEQEVVELVEEIGGGRDINKPWKKSHVELYNSPVIITDHVKGEAMDVLCFALNILILSGITSDNIDEEFEKVYQKNLKRVSDGY
jgi:NTP pyrophosphatase (non-canonical NTP hydrolase)